MTYYDDLQDNRDFLGQRLKQKNIRRCKSESKKNASLKSKMDNLEQSIQITGFRVFLGPKQIESSKNIYSHYSGDTSENINNFNIKISKPMISRVLLQTGAFDESSTREFTYEKRENVFRNELKSKVKIYRDPLNEYSKAVKQKSMPCLSSPQPNFRRQTANLVFHQNKKSDIRSSSEDSEYIDTSSAVTTSSESLNLGKISDMSSLVLSNMKTGRLSRISSIIKNIWNSATKEKNKNTEINPQIDGGTFTTDKNKPLISPHKSFDNLNDLFIQKEKQNYQYLNRITSNQSNSVEEEETMTKPVELTSPLYNSVSDESSAESSKPFLTLALESTDIEKMAETNLPRRTTVNTINIITVQNISALKSYPETCVQKNSSGALEEGDTESSKPFPTTLAFEDTDTQRMIEPSLPHRTKVNPVDIIKFQNMSATKSCPDSCLLNKDIVEGDLINHEKFNEMSHAESNMSSDVSYNRSACPSKSVIFCSSSHYQPGDSKETMIDLCDDCYTKTRRKLSEMHSIFGNEASIINDKSVDICSELFHHIPPNQSYDFKDVNESLTSHIPRKLNIDFNIMLEAVNNHLLGLKPVNKDFLKEAMESLSKKWILVVSDKYSKVQEVSNYLKYFQEFSNELLNMIMFSTDREGNNALHFACGNNRFDVAEELLKYECVYALLMEKNKLGHSPLMICSVSQPKSDKEWSVVKTIIHMGDVNKASSFSRQTPLMSAASRGCLQMAQLLLEAGADPNLQDSDGSTALMYAAVHGHDTCVSLLLEHPKCNPRIKDYDQQTALSVALGAGYRKIAFDIYLHSRKRNKVNKNKLRNHLQKNNDEHETNSGVHADTISQSLSDPH